MTFQFTQMIAEFIGTFIFLMVIIDLVFRSSTDPVVASGSVPLYIGLGLTVSIYITTGLGGFGHLNPVVSTVCLTNGNVSVGEWGSLIIAQLLAGVLAYSVWWGMGRKGIM